MTWVTERSSGAVCTGLFPPRGYLLVSPPGGEISARTHKAAVMPPAFPGTGLRLTVVFGHGSRKEQLTPLDWSTAGHELFFHWPHGGSLSASDNCAASDAVVQRTRIASTIASRPSTPRIRRGRVTRLEVGMQLALSRARAIRCGLTTMEPGIFNRLVVLLDRLAPSRGALVHALAWARHLRLPVRAISLQPSTGLPDTLEGDTTEVSLKEACVTTCTQQGLPWEWIHRQGSLATGVLPVLGAGRPPGPGTRLAAISPAGSCSVKPCGTTRCRYSSVPMNGFHLPAFLMVNFRASDSATPTLGNGRDPGPLSCGRVDCAGTTADSERAGALPRNGVPSRHWPRADWTRILTSSSSPTSPWPWSMSLAGGVASWSSWSVRHALPGAWRRGQTSGAIWQELAPSLPLLAIPSPMLQKQDGRSHVAGVKSREPLPQPARR